MGLNPSFQVFSGRVGSVKLQRGLKNEDAPTQPMKLHVLIACLSIALTHILRADGDPDAVTIRTDFSKTIHTMRGGIGASWHAIENEIPSHLEKPHPVWPGPVHGGSVWGGNPPAEDDRRWQQIERHADWLGLDFIRVEVEQRMWQPEREQFTWDTPEMRILYRILDWCESRKADVMLQVMWGNVDWNAHPEFRGDPVARVHSGPYDMRAFGEGVAALAKHLTQTRKYTCIRWLCINNEPGHEWSWWQQPPNTPMPIRAGLSAVHVALEKAGLNLPISGPDWTDLPALEPQKIDFDEFIGAYDLHSYQAKFDGADTQGYSMSEAEKRLAAWRGWASAKGKPLFLSEIGTMVYGWGYSDTNPARFESSLKNAEMVVRGINLGVDGFNRWSFINRGDLDGQWQMITTWDSGKKRLTDEITPYPNDYFVYGLISRLTAKHSRVVNCAIKGGDTGKIQRVFATALRSPRDDASVIIVNDAGQAWSGRLAIRNSPGTALHRYQVTIAQRDRADLKIAPLDKSSLTDGNAEIVLNLPPMSLTVFSTAGLAHEEPGLSSR